MLTKILNKLYEYSNIYIDVITDENLEIPGFSYIDEDLYGRMKPMIVLNPRLFPKEGNVLAHIIAHEWGHHVLKHVFTDPSTITSLEEAEADEYASNFIREFMYDTDPIIEYLKCYSPNYYDRIKLLLIITSS